MDLVPATTPKGLVAFFNIFPALIVGSASLPEWQQLISADQSRLAPNIKRKDPVCSSSGILHIRQLARDSRACQAILMSGLQLIA